MAFSSNALAFHRRSHVQAISGFICLWAAVAGCASTRSTSSGYVERSCAKASFVSWNLRSMFGTPREANQSRAVRIASLSNRELYRLMQRYPAPDLNTISGKWHGINKGIGPALAGLMQDVKVIESSPELSCNCSPEGCANSSGRQSGSLVGHNVLVQQVAMRELACRGWQPMLHSKTCEPITMGNFNAIAPTCRASSSASGWSRGLANRGELPNAAKFDYTTADNPWYDPSRFLIDEIVQIDENILLGRATSKVGSLRIPVAYFVLTRAAGNCRSAGDGQAANQLGDEAFRLDELSAQHGRVVVSLTDTTGQVAGAMPTAGATEVPEAATVQSATEATLDNEPSASDRTVAKLSPSTEVETFIGRIERRNGPRISTAEELELIDP